MAGFRVAPGSLDRASAEIAEARGRVPAPTDAFGFGDAACFGDPAVGAACHEFHGRWRAAGAAMAAELDRVAASLTASARAYVRAEQQVGQSLLGPARG